MPSNFYDRAYSIEESETKGFYRDWAATYDEELVDGKGYAQPRRCSAVLAEALPDRSSSIIDLGCGTGLMGRALQTHGFTTVDGLDFSPEMIERAEATGAYRRFFTGDLNAVLEFDDAAYGAVCAVGVFSYAHVYAAALDEMLRILAPGGPLVIGLNGQYWDEGMVQDKLRELADEGLIRIDLEERGDHMPGAEVDGVVVLTVKL